MKIALTLCAVFCLLPFSANANLSLQQARIAPEADSGRYPLSAAIASQAMAVTAHPLATQAAVNILRRGGSAMDAAIAAQAVLGLVEPQSSGLAGGGFLVHAYQGQVTAIDGRETAPSAADSSYFLNADGKPMSFPQALKQARAVGVPGMVDLLAQGHARWGKLSWAETLLPAIRHAEQGIPVSHRLHELIKQDPLLRSDKASLAYFFDDQGRALTVGSTLTNPAYAELLKTLAEHGPRDFYEGQTGQRLVQQLRAAGSVITLQDWQGYRALVSSALCIPLQRMQACSAPPPSGGFTVLQGLALWLQAEANASNPLRRFIPGRQQRTDLKASSLYRLMEAQRLAFADRQLYSADPAFVPVPTAGLLSDDYIRARAALIKDRAMTEAPAGQPEGAPRLAADPSLQSFGTTQISIVDSEGHWVAMTSSIESAFGSRLMMDGLLMNNQLTDFSFAPEVDGVPVANRVQAGKRPRSAMSPVIVLSTRGEPLLATGSAGGVRIMGYNSRTLSAWLLGVRDARKLMSLPHVLARGDMIEHEHALDARVQQELTLRGHEPREAILTSGSNVILRYGRGLQGAADPRRPGTAAGY